METIHIDDDTSRIIDQKLVLLDTLQNKYELTGDKNIKEQMIKTANEINNLLLTQTNDTWRTKTNPSSNERWIEKESR